MAINDISLTAGMRANLVSLQNTVNLLNRTQQRLSTGKAVNSALDNPINFFAAQSLNNRASDLAGYKDVMSNAVQTIRAANEGVSGLTTLLGAAKAIASSVEGLPANSAFTSANLTVSGIVAAETIVIGGVTLTAGATTNATTFDVSGSDAQTAASLAAALNMGASAIKATSVSGSMITLADPLAHVTNLSVTGTAMSNGTASAMTVAANSERGSLISQYNSIMAQINSMADDSSFQGVNLLKAGTLTVNFGGGSNLVITSTNTHYADLGLATITTEWNLATDTGTTQMTAVDTALTTLRSKSKDLSNNLAIINARQDFSANLGNVLLTGADNLTLADTNQEGANMLMLQTRQSLGTTALSLSSQAAQSVLRLFA
jgi:flagellin-like hook-associated protein FlgL